MVRIVHEPVGCGILLANVDFRHATYHLNVAHHGGNCSAGVACPRAFGTITAPFASHFIRKKYIVVLFTPHAWAGNANRVARDKRIPVVKKHLRFLL